VDISKVDNVKIGLSTRDDVISVLGKPYGKAFCPSQLADFKDSCTKAKEVWGWVTFQHGVGNKFVERKYVLIMFGEDGKVVDVKAADLKD
jgi:outer membrane protein assembly factor BamE (lipoprotein component of BamABCDE complex)